MPVSLKFPTSDTGLLQWSQNVVTLITPVPANWGLVVGDVTTYTAAHTAFSGSVAACDPSVRTKGAVVTKRQNKAALKAAAGVVANKIYAATPAISDGLKTEIGMPPRAIPTPVPAPSAAPGIDIVSTLNNTVRIRLHDREGGHRGKPPGTIGAALFSFVGDAPAADMSHWKFEGNTGRVTKVDVTFPASVPAGSKVWLTAFWFNGRKQSGPATTPVGFVLPGGFVQQAA